MFAHSAPNIKESEIKYSEENGIKELIIRYPKSNGKLPGWVSFIKMKRYKKYHDLGLSILKKKGFSPDLVHCNVMNPAGIIAKYWRRKHKLPYVITEHWTGYLQTDGRYQSSAILKLSLPKIAKRSELILPVSEDLKNALSTNNLGKKFKVLRNVVNTDKFFPKEKSKDRFLVVADLEDQQKNVSGILEAFKAFNINYPEIKLSIAGGGPDEVSIKQKAKELGLDKVVTFHGRIPAESLNEILAQSFASILFSNYENLPCVIVESFSAGIPFIATNVGGIAEVINKERGIIINKGNQKELAEAFELMLKNDFDRGKLRDYALNNFSYKEIGQQLDKIYRGIIG